MDKNLRRSSMDGWLRPGLFCGFHDKSPDANLDYGRVIFKRDPEKPVSVARPGFTRAQAPFGEPRLFRFLTPKDRRETVRNGKVIRIAKEYDHAVSYAVGLLMQHVLDRKAVLFHYGLEGPFYGNLLCRCPAAVSRDNPRCYPQEENQAATRAREPAPRGPFPQSCPP